MPKIIDNPFLRLIREKRRAIGMHQMELAAVLHVNTGSMSEYLTGKTRMPEAVFLDMCGVLRLSNEEARRAWLMHSLLHVPANVRAYVQMLESDRVSYNLCDDRLQRLRDLTDGMLADRRADDNWVPVLIAPDEGSSRIAKAISKPDDDDTRDERDG